MSPFIANLIWTDALLSSCDGPLYKQERAFFWVTTQEWSTMVSVKWPALSLLVYSHYGILPHL